MSAASPPPASPVPGTPPAVAPQAGSLDYALMAALIIVWGSAYALTHTALTAFAPMQVVLVRLVIGAVALGIVCAALRQSLPPFQDLKAWSTLALIGCVGTLLPFGLISEAQARVPSALAAIYIAAAPLAVAVMAHMVVPGERLSVIRAVGVLLGFCGIVVLFAPGLTGAGPGIGRLTDQLMLLAAAISYGTASILVRLTQPNLHPIAMSFGFVLVSSAVALVIVSVAGPEGGLVGVAAALAQAPAPALLSLLGLGLGSTALGNWLYVIVIRRVGPVFLSNVGNLVPFWSLLIGAAFLGESLPATALAGLAVILCGIWLVQRRRH